MLLIVGPFPPPPGGVAVHVQRLADLCTDAEIPVQIVSPYGDPQGGDPLALQRLSGGRWRRALTLSRIIRDSPATAVHLHASALGRLAWIGPLLLRAVGQRPLLLTIHSGSWPPADGRAFTGLKGRQLGRLLKRCHTVIAVNQRQADFLQSLCPLVLVVPAYLPAPGPGTMPAMLRQAVTKARDEGRLIALTSGNGMPHYRFEDVVDAVEQAGPNRWLIVVATYREFDEPYLSRVAQRCPEVDVVMVRDLYPPEFQAVLVSADVYVRATTRDGDAVTIREALAFGKPVIASDVITRPPGVIVYPVGQPDQLARGLRSVHQSAAPDRKAPDSYSNWHNLKELYCRLGLGPHRETRDVGDA